MASGKCGKNLTWMLDDKGTLKISGTGKMKSYVDEKPPWNSSEVPIKKLIIDRGAKSIGSFAFKNLNSLMSVDIPDSVKKSA